MKLHLLLLLLIASYVSLEDPPDPIDSTQNGEVNQDKEKEEVVGKVVQMLKESVNDSRYQDCEFCCLHSLFLLNSDC